MSKKYLLLTLLLCAVLLLALSCGGNGSETSADTTVSPEPTAEVPGTDTAEPAVTSEVTGETETSTGPDITSEPGADTQADITTSHVTSDKAEVTTEPEVTTADVTSAQAEDTKKKEPEETQPVHTHLYNIEDASAKYFVSAADCTNPAQYLLHCSCGAVSDKTFSYGKALGHDYGYFTADSNATCLSDGTESRVCARCGDKEVIPAPFTKLEHDYTGKTADEKYLVSAADCENAAVYSVHCTMCGGTNGETFEYGKALGHEISSYVSDNNANLLEDATESAVCSRCSQKLTRTLSGTRLQTSAAETPLSAYTVLDYLSFDGTVSIPSGITGDATWIYTMHSYKTGTEQTQGFKSDAFWGVNSAGIYTLECMSTGESISTEGTDRVEFVICGNTLSLKVNSSATVSTELSTYSGSIPGELYIGSTDSPSGGACFELYGLTCLQEGRRVRVFIPVRRNSDGATGLYDEAFGVFYALPESEYNMFFGDSSVYDQKMAEFSADTMLQAYTYSEEAMEELGMLPLYYWNNTLTPTDDPNAATFFFRVKPVLRDGVIYKVYVLAIRGTDASNEWTSDVNVGDSGDFHQGFAAAADFIWNRIEEYVDADPEHNILLVSGHSRGAPVGAVLSAKLMDDGTYFNSDGLRAYVAACSNYSRRDVKYGNIFIFKNPGDLVAVIPPAIWGLHTEGVEIVFDVSSDAIASMNTLRLTLEGFKGKAITDYAGLTSTDDAIVYINSGFPDMSILQDESNIKLIGEIGEAISEGGFSSSDLGTMIVKYYPLLNAGNGDSNARIQLIMYMMSNYQGIYDAHIPQTYWAWIYSGEFTAPVAE